MWCCFSRRNRLFSAALEGDRDLIIWAASKRIMLATPASLIALLRSVSVSWQQHAQSENARAIAAAAQELLRPRRQIHRAFRTASATAWKKPTTPTMTQWEVTNDRPAKWRTRNEARRRNERQRTHRGQAIGNRFEDFLPEIRDIESKWRAIGRPVRIGHQVAVEPMSAVVDRQRAKALIKTPD